jgi:hypothetical protein
MSIICLKPNYKSGIFFLFFSNGIDLKTNSLLVLALISCVMTITTMSFQMAVILPRLMM